MRWERDGENIITVMTTLAGRYSLKSREERVFYASKSGKWSLKGMVIGSTQGQRNGERGHLVYSHRYPLLNITLSPYSSENNTLILLTLISLGRKDV